MDFIDVLTMVIIAIPIVVILTRISISDRMKKVYVEDNYNEVKRIRA